MISGFIQLVIMPFGLSNAVDLNVGVDGSGLVASQRCGSSGVKVHAPSSVKMRISGLYTSTLPDGQVAQVAWDDGLKAIDYADGSEPGLCDTVISANLLSINDGEYVDWDLHDLSEANNDIGHGLGQDALGLETCTDRVYSLLIKNREDSEAAMTVGNSATNEWTGFLDAGSTLTLPADSIFALISDQPSGMPVDGDDNCNLKIAASGGTLNYGVNFCGCSN